jgi:hypothetical protein
VFYLLPLSAEAYKSACGYIFDTLQAEKCDSSLNFGLMSFFHLFDLVSFCIALVYALNVFKFVFFTVFIILTKELVTWVSQYGQTLVLIRYKNKRDSQPYFHWTRDKRN